MTKEPIMIDDVNVAGCKDFFESECFAGEKFRWCKDNKDCYYKKLKRLENEYEGFAAKYTDMEIALKAKEQECEILNNTITYLEYIQEELLTKIDQLKKNNEELRKFHNYWSKVEQKNLKLSTQNETYKQALQEIKEIANKNEVCPYVISHHCDKYDCKRKEHCEIAQILQKCEVIDE